ncbi:MAG: hypothetical protein B7Z12_18615 [Caulobacter vibrioides]|uniref:Uncharacterized protein n=1 Tax=Caulobacter vibrioides TaxID=155892 RepID=A0A258CU19_CAUVI|nr:MAG: hypothetical protein B7Z12_18615 [Caulobacter vibrioides]
MTITRRAAASLMAGALIGLTACGSAQAADDLLIAPPGGSAPHASRRCKASLANASATNWPG